MVTVDIRISLIFGKLYLNFNFVFTIPECRPSNTLNRIIKGVFD